MTFKLYDIGEGNVFIGGGTGAGKTVLANETFMLSDRVGFFFNHEDEDNIGGIEVRSLEEAMAHLMESGKKKFNYQLDLFDQRLEMHHETLVKGLMKLGNDINMGSVLVTDEAHEISPMGSTKTSLHLAVKRGRKHGVNNIVVSQEVASLDTRVITQCQYLVWVGKPGPKVVEYFRSNWKELDISPWQQNKPGHYTIIHESGEVVGMNQRADSRFA